MVKGLKAKKKKNHDGNSYMYRHSKIYFMICKILILRTRKKIVFVWMFIAVGDTPMTWRTSFWNKYVTCIYTVYLLFASRCVARLGCESKRLRVQICTLFLYMENWTGKSCRIIGSATCRLHILLCLFWQSGSTSRT